MLMKDAMKDAPRRSSIADEKRSVSFLVIDLARRPGIMGNGIFDVIRDVATKKGEIVLTTDSTHSPDAKKSSFLPQLFLEVRFVFIGVIITTLPSVSFSIDIPFHHNGEQLKDSTVIV
jgi:hypothetical protein